MTVIRQKHVQRMAESLDEVIEAAEEYKAYLQGQMEAHKGIRDDAPPMYMFALKYQIGNLERFIATLDDQVLEQLTDIVNVLDPMEQAQRGELV